MKKILVTAALAATLPSCLVAQNDTVRSLSYPEARKVIPIGYSKETVIKVLGKPQTINSLTDEETWSYVDQKPDARILLGSLKGVDTKGMIIRLNRSVRVKSEHQTTFNL